MEFNYTLIGQLISFIIFVYICMKYIWPPLLDALNKRQEFISEGINNANKANERLEQVKEESKSIIDEAKRVAKENIMKADNESKKIISLAKEEGQNIISEAKIKSKQEYDNIKTELKENLRKEMFKYVVLASEKIIKSQIDEEKAKNYLEKKKLTLIEENK